MTQFRATLQGADWRGTVRLLRTRWDASRLYLSEPMLQRLRAAVGNHEPPVALGKDWLRLSEAAREAGVTAATIVKWGNQGELARLHEPGGWRYPRDAVRTRTRTYWQNVRFHRATQPEWLQADTRPGR